jgi:hypothetical protein
MLVNLHDAVFKNTGDIFPHWHVLSLKLLFIFSDNILTIPIEFMVD